MLTPLLSLDQPLISPLSTTLELTAPPKRSVIELLVSRSELQPLHVMAAEPAPSPNDAWKPEWRVCGASCAYTVVAGTSSAAMKQVVRSFIGTLRWDELSWHISKVVGGSDSRAASFRKGASSSSTGGSVSVNHRPSVRCVAR